MCKISVITPVYKVEKYLNKCIDSILNQTFTDFELFIVDDGSPDRCGQIADEYAKKDRRVRVIHKNNGGAPSARNAGIVKASGEYLYFPDSDDWLEPSYLEQLYNTAIRTGANLVVSGYTMEYYENNSNQTYQVSVTEKNYANQKEVRQNLHQYFDNMMMAVPWNKLYKADYIHDNNILFPNLKWDDLHFNMEVIMNINSVAISSSAGYHFFRSRQGSETTTVFDGHLFEKRKEQFKHILKVYKYWKITDKNIMSVIYGYYAARLVECVVEISISNCNNKRSEIKQILDDPISYDAISKGKISSSTLSIAAYPMRKRNITGCLLMGNMIGFTKKHMTKQYYRLKSKLVNHATVKAK